MQDHDWDSRAAVQEIGIPMRVAIFVVILAPLFAAMQPSYAREAKPKRSIAGLDFRLVQTVVSTVTRSEHQFQPEKFDIYIVEDQDEYFVTFEPPEWRSGGDLYDPPGLALEAVVEKKGLAVRSWYWAACRDWFGLGC